MSKEILNLEPQNIWKHFYSLTQIPRPSKKEGRVIDFIKRFGEVLHLETIVDATGNVIIRKPATPGMEGSKGVILQGHLDMVPQKNKETDHDFEVDPIDAYIDGEWVTARGTTLGSDNGMGVAAAMAVLESTTLRHGPVEALFTIDEETGMAGAVGLQPGILRGDILLNMDSEDEGELYIGCAGGVDTNINFQYTQQAVSEGYEAFKISVKGLRGGHSGLDIHLGRGNACLIINKLLLNAQDQFGLRLSTIDAGSLRNAIPREAFVSVVVPLAEKDNFQRFIIEANARTQDSLQVADPEVIIHCEEADMPTHVIDLDTQNNLLVAVTECPNGVIAWAEDMPEVVETSSNLASIKSDGAKVSIALLSRSAIDAERDAVAQKIAEVFRSLNAQAHRGGAYPGWKPNLASPIKETMKQVYHERFGKIPDEKVIHAGLECGILGATYPHWDMISFGPTIRNPHSPDEKVNIETVGKFWNYLVSTLEQIPAK